MPEPPRVGIAIVERRGRYLVRQRPLAEGSPMPGYWEFPGGKCEPDESPRNSALRECLEESGLAVAIVQLRCIITHTYPHGTVLLHYYDCEPIDARSNPDPSSGFVWVSLGELVELRFPEANERVIAELAALPRAIAGAKFE